MFDLTIDDIFDLINDDNPIVRDRAFEVMKLFGFK